MARAKIAITLPEDVLDAVDAAAQERGVSRSGFISRVLVTALGAQRDAEIRRRLDELFADQGLVGEQRRIAQELDAVGTDWSEETW